MQNVRGPNKEAKDGRNK